jgi:nicotinamidase-related amidase
MSPQYSFIDVDDSILVVIDVQESFLDKLPGVEREPLITRIGWLIEVARGLQVPIFAMAEDLPNLGGPVPYVAERLPPDTCIWNKMIFGLAHQEEIVTAVRATGRRTTVLVGLETDVCVAHSAFGLLNLGFQVAVVADATGSPGIDHKIGLERMRQAGAQIVSVKSLYYEWVRTVARDDEFRRKHFSLIGLADAVKL